MNFFFLGPPAFLSARPRQRAELSSVQGKLANYKIGNKYGVNFTFFIDLKHAFLPRSISSAGVVTVIQYVVSARPHALLQDTPYFWCRLSGEGLTAKSCRRPIFVEKEPNSTLSHIGYRRNQLKLNGERLPLNGTPRTRIGDSRDNKIDAPGVIVCVMQACMLSHQKAIAYAADPIAFSRSCNWRL